MELAHPQCSPTQPTPKSVASPINSLVHFDVMGVANVYKLIRFREGGFQPFSLLSSPLAGLELFTPRLRLQPLPAPATSLLFRLVEDVRTFFPSYRSNQLRLRLHRRFGDRIHLPIPVPGHLQRHLRHPLPLLPFISDYLAFFSRHRSNRL